MTEQKKSLPLSDEELFRQAVGEVHPIKKSNTIPPTRPQHKKQPPIPILQNPSTQSQHADKNIYQNSISKVSPSPTVPLTFTDLLESIEDSVSGYTNKIHANLDKLEFNRRGTNCPLFRKLKKGLIVVEHEVDLHHYTVNEAKHEVIRSLLYAYHEDIQCLRIIHGKGNRSTDSHSPLKWAIKHWLEQILIVRGFCSCTPKDGGTGAVYVLLGK